MVSVSRSLLLINRSISRSLLLINRIVDVVHLVYVQVINDAGGEAGTYNKYGIRKIFCNN
jgi:hypothetical protein